VYYIFADHLGSTRVITDSSGTVCRDVDYFPFGAEKITLNTCALLSSKFATYERDPETGLDYAVFRYYNSRLGRFMSPDPLAGTIGDPQSLNRYAYVLNDPVNLIDPLGLQEEFSLGQTCVTRGSGEGTTTRCIQGRPRSCGGYTLNGIQLNAVLPECYDDARDMLLERLGKDFLEGDVEISVIAPPPKSAGGEGRQVDPLIECKGNADRDFLRANSATTGFWRGIGKIAKGLAVGAVGHRYGGVLGSIAALGYEAREVPRWLKEEWKANWDYSTRLALCEAAFGPK
jgi:RHS repeat-associated protein